VTLSYTSCVDNKVREGTLALFNRLLSSYVTVQNAHITSGQTYRELGDVFLTLCLIHRNKIGKIQTVKPAFHTRFATARPAYICSPRDDKPAL